ncbi:MAG: NADH:flavin oxidoreductase, partial [Clostridia bacterium]|nr:NADH:flavin oxidoreductase [Clostridia bacterium]
DAYGGSTKNRMRILLDILSGIRTAAPGLHVTVKINCSDFTYHGLDEAESLAICEVLAEAGIDSIEVSGNGTSVQGVRAGKSEGYFAPFATALAEKVNVPVICVGGWRSIGRMENVLNDTRIAFLSLSRPLLREPDWPNKLKSGESTVSKCVSCNACYTSPSHRCVFRKRDLK